MPNLEPDAEYQHIREEIRSEHVLISNRLTWYVTSQSFLVSAFAISRANGFVWFPWFSTILLPAIGFSASMLIFPSIVGALETLQLWHRKQQDFFARNSDFQAAFELHRATWIDARGLLFPKFMPVLFGSFWLIVHVSSYFR